MCRTPSSSAQPHPLRSFAAAGRREHQHSHPAATLPTRRLPRPSVCGGPHCPGRGREDDRRMRPIATGCRSSDDGLFLTDGGIETVLIFHEGSSCRVRRLRPAQGRGGDRGAAPLLRALRRAGRRARRLGFVAESPTWRASPRWARELGYAPIELDGFNRRAIALMEELRRELRPLVVISGCVGPQRRRLQPVGAAAEDAAEAYHATQIATFADTAADMVTAITMTYAEEAIGVTRPRSRAGLPVAISFTRRDRRPAPERPDARRRDRPGRRRHGRRARVLHDQLRPPDALRGGARRRRRGSSASAACARTPRRCSHAELDEATELDEGDPADLARPLRRPRRPASAA